MPVPVRQSSAPSTDGSARRRAALARADRLERYEGGTEWALTVLAFLFLAVYGVPILWPDLPETMLDVLARSSLVIWFVFALDLTVRLVLAPRRLAYAVRHPIDILAVLLPMLRPLRVLRVFTIGHTLFARGSGLVRTGQAVVFSAGVLILIGALAILDAERGVEGSNIGSFADALWWAMATVTTVGYGDLYPVTALGRAVAAALMVVGISVLGVVTATVAAWFVSADRNSSPTHSDKGPVESPESSPPPDEMERYLISLDGMREAGALTAAEHARVRERLLARAGEG